MEIVNLVPRVLSLPRESTLVTAGHVSMHANSSRTRVGPQLKFVNTLIFRPFQLLQHALSSYVYNRSLFAVLSTLSREVSVALLQTLILLLLLVLLLLQHS